MNQVAYYFFNANFPSAHFCSKMSSRNIIAGTVILLFFCGFFQSFKGAASSTFSSFSKISETPSNVSGAPSLGESTSTKTQDQANNTAFTINTTVIHGSDSGSSAPTAAVSICAAEDGRDSTASTADTTTSLADIANSYTSVPSRDTIGGVEDFAEMNASVILVLNITRQGLLPISDFENISSDVATEFCLRSPASCDNAPSRQRLSASGPPLEVGGSISIIVLEAVREWPEFQPRGSAFITLNVYARDEVSRRLLSADSLTVFFEDVEVKETLKAELGIELVEVNKGSYLMEANIRLLNGYRTIIFVLIAVFLATLLLFFIAVFVCWLFGLRVVKMHGFRLTWNRVGPHVPRARYIANGSVTPTPSGCSTLTTASGVDGREPPPQLHHISVSDLVCRYVEEEAEIVASTPAPSVASSGTPDATEPGGGRAMSVSLCIPTKDTCF